MGKYDDIINLDRPISRKHRPMPIENRAPQFAPFAALTGYDDAVEETARLTDRRIELSEEERALLDDKIAKILSNADESPEISAEYFIPDAAKEGGSYATKTGRIKRIDTIERAIIWQDGTITRLDDVLDIKTPGNR